MEILATRDARAAQFDTDQRAASIVNTSLFTSLVGNNGSEVNPDQNLSQEKRVSFQNSILMTNSIDAYKENKIFDLPSEKNPSTTEINNNYEIKINNDYE